MASILFGIVARTLLCIVFFLLIFTLFFGQPLTWTSVIIFVIISTFFELVDAAEKRKGR